MPQDVQVHLHDHQPDSQDGAPGEEKRNNDTFAGMVYETSADEVEDAMVKSIEETEVDDTHGDVACDKTCDTNVEMKLGAEEKEVLDGQEVEEDVHSRLLEERVFAQGALEEERKEQEAQPPGTT